jgi:hypothetical protein
MGRGNRKGARRGQLAPDTVPILTARGQVSTLSYPEREWNYKKNEGIDPAEASDATSVITLADGTRIVCPAYPSDCEWVEVIDEDGTLRLHLAAEQLSGEPAAAMSRLFEAASPGRMPLPDGVVDTDFPDECALELESGNATIRSAAAPFEADYVRIVLADLAEEAYWYWSIKEWEREPQEVLGAILGCACGIG